MTAQFVDVTEIAGQPISAEQLFRTCHRYHWAARMSAGKEVLEVGCGAGQGLGLLALHARSLAAGDYSPEVLETARRVYGDRIKLSEFSAESLPFADSSLDVILIFEAIYYVPDLAKFFRESKRCLRPGGQLLIVTANKDLFDFTPSPYSQRYLGVAELDGELAEHGFACEFAALIDTRKVSMRQKLLRPVKTLVTKFGLIPRSMHGKAWMKRLFFGEMAVMPADISLTPIDYIEPDPHHANTANLTHKVIYCCATASVR
jgi:SAM-dependent methyltransferase